MSAGGRYVRTEAILGSQALSRLRAARVAVFGLGGVGGWCAEALVRTGVGELMMVDSDVVAASNINRQLAATVDTVGIRKTDALAERLRKIDPEVRLDLRPVRYETSNASDFDLGRFDYVIDAIDSPDAKAALIRHALSEPTAKLFSSMGAACKTDSLRVRATRFRKVEGDGLARALRQRFRRSGGIPERDFVCVWSDEQPVVSVDADSSSLGSLCHVTAAFGLALAGLVIRDTVGMMG